MIKSVFDIDYDEMHPIAKEEHRGKASHVTDHDGKRGLLIIMPCGHFADITSWNLTDIDTDHPSATPSIFCHNAENESGKSQDCWHGYLTNGEFKEC